MQVGLVGLGKMGGAVARRLIADGHVVLGLDSDPAAATDMAAHGVQTVMSIESLIEKLAQPRLLWLMLPAGEATQETIANLEAHLDANDMIVDAGNSYYKDTIEQHHRLARRSVIFADAGTSGGVAGLEHGFCLMLGGSAEAIERLRPLLKSLAADSGSAWTHVGPAGAGHYVKMVHNGIEYGAMQAYAEGFALLDAKEEFDLDVTRIAAVWQQGSLVRSWLLDLIVEIFNKDRQLNDIAPVVADSGEGRWTAQEAIELGVSAPVITLALLARLKTQDNDQFGERLLASLRQQFGGHAVTRNKE